MGGSEGYREGSVWFEGILGIRVVRGFSSFGTA